MKRLALIALVTTGSLFGAYHVGRNKGFDQGWDKGYIRGLENPTAFDQGYTHGCEVAADINQDNDETLAACIESERG